MNIQYRISTWKDYYDQQWRFVIKKYRRVTFKVSKRVGWKWDGFVTTGQEGKTFGSRLEALNFARKLRTTLLTN